jgi:hypothetical protein
VQLLQRVALHPSPVSFSLISLYLFHFVAAKTPESKLWLIPHSLALARLSAWRFGASRRWLL